MRQKAQRSMAFIKDGKRIVDLRSDTVTQPTPEMREAMAAAEVGDDVFGDDPTVNRLEAMAAERMGKEAALFVASGTMGNLVALLTHCQRGHEVIVGDQSHTFIYEAGGAAALGGIHPRTVKNQPDGTLLLADIEGAIRAENVHYPRTRLICLENTHNRAMARRSESSTCGRWATWPIARTEVARGRRAHFQRGDCVGRGCERIGRACRFDPVLSVEGTGRAGRVAVVRQPRVYLRGAAQSQDGGRRDAPGGRAGGGGHRLADQDGGSPGGGSRQRAPVDAGPCRNPRPCRRAGAYQHCLFPICARDQDERGRIRQRLEQRNVRLLSLGPRRFRAVTHCWIDADDIEVALDAMREVMRGGGRMRGDLIEQRAILPT